MVLLLFPIQNVGAQGGFDSGGGNNSSGLPDCTERNAFLTFPNWFRNLKCEDGGSGAPVFTGLNDIWTVGANVLDIIIQLAGLLAVGFIIYGGIRYITSQGEPENLQSAKKIVANAIIGLVLAIMASTVVGFIAGSF